MLVQKGGTWQKAFQAMIVMHESRLLSLPPPEEPPGTSLAYIHLRRQNTDSITGQASPAELPYLFSFLPIQPLMQGWLGA